MSCKDEVVGDQVVKLKSEDLKRMKGSSHGQLANQKKCVRPRLAQTPEI